MSAYGHICVKCHHDAWRHGLIEGENVAGRYECPCGCIVPQRGPFRGVTQAEHEAWVQEHPAPIPDQQGN